jgi:hypothetical protein
MKERSNISRNKNKNIFLILFFMFLLSINQIHSNNSLNLNNESKTNESNKNNNSKELNLNTNTNTNKNTNLIKLPIQTEEKITKLNSLFDINIQKFNENKNEIFDKFKFNFIEMKTKNTIINTNTNKNQENDNNTNNTNDKKGKINIDNMKKFSRENQNFIEKITLRKNIILKGWLKYMEITANLSCPPKTFNENKSYSRIKSTCPNSKIPGKYFFYFELNAEKLTIYDNDKEGNRKKINELDIISIGEDPKLNPCSGGIEKIGHFTEGFCFLIKFRRGKCKKIWEICDKCAGKINKWVQSLTKAQQNILKLIKNKNKNKKKNKNGKGKGKGKYNNK